LEKYGVENPNQSATIRAKTMKTTRERYGTDYASQNEAVKQKGKDTCFTPFFISNADYL
jgi:hypothetical protein